MKVLVTGAAGFVGAHVARLLVEEGYEVRALIRTYRRTDSDWAGDVEYFQGDLRNPDEVDRAVKGCGAVFHVAADYRLWVRDPHEMFATNVEGTRHVMDAALRHRVERVVHTSTVGALGLPEDGGPGTEETPIKEKDLCGPYKQSKYRAEQAVLEYAGRGCPVVIVNPSTPVGPGDWKPTPTGRMIVDFLNRRMPAYLDTGLNLVHVKDVARGHLLALEKGRIGEKYILGNRNMTLGEIFQALEAISGIPAPKLRLPYAPVLAVAYVSEAMARWVTRREPRIPLTAVRMARKRMFFDSSKAVRELGMPQTPVDRALREAVAWFQANGYVH